METPQVFIYHGLDTFPIRKKISTLENYLSNASKHYETLHWNLAGKEDANQKIIELETLFSSPSFGVDGVIVIIWNYEVIFKKNLEWLTRILKQVEHHFLFLISVNLQEKKLPTSYISKHKNLSYEWHPFIEKGKIKARLENFAQTHQFKINPDCLDYLVDHFHKKIELVHDARIDKVDAELENIRLYFKKNSIITIDKIEDIIDDLRVEVRANEILHAFFEKKIQLCLKNFLIFIRNQGSLNSLISKFLYETIDLLKFKETSTSPTQNNTYNYNYSHSYYAKKQDILNRRSALFNLDEVMTLLNDFISLDKKLKSESLTNPNIHKEKIQLKSKLTFEKIILVRLGEKIERKKIQK